MLSRFLQEGFAQFKSTAVFEIFTVHIVIIQNLFKNILLLIEKINFYFKKIIPLLFTTRGEVNGIGE